MLSRLSRHIATFLAIIVGITGLFAILYAWKLPPFQSSLELTEDAYIQGEVTMLAPQVSGAIEEVAVQDFQHVSKGDLLIRIDDRIYRQQLAKAKAVLAVKEAAISTLEQDTETARAHIRSAEARAQSARSSLSLAESSLERFSKLQESHAISDLEAEEHLGSRDQANAALQEALADVAAARQDLASISSRRQSIDAEIDEAKATIDLAEIELANTEITAPVDGRLGQVGARTGQYVTPGTRLTSIVPEHIWVIANFKETQLEGMKIGQPVTFDVDALGGRELTGTISRFSPATGSQYSVISANNATGNFIKIAQRIPVMINIDARQAGLDQLVPGMSVVVRVDTAAKPVTQPTGDRPAPDAPSPNLISQAPSSAPANGL